MEWISLTTSLSSHGTLLYLTQWVELACHLRGQPAKSVSLTLSRSHIQTHLRKLFLSSSIWFPPSLSLSLVLFLVQRILFLAYYINLVIKSGYDHCRLGDMITNLPSLPWKPSPLIPAAWQMQPSPQLLTNYSMLPLLFGCFSVVEGILFLATRWCINPKNLL